MAAWAGLRAFALQQLVKFQYTVDFSGYPPTPNGSDKIPTEDGGSTAVQYDPVYRFYPVSGRFADYWVEDDVEELDVDETVTIGGFTTYRIDNAAVLVERGVH